MSRREDGEEEIVHAGDLVRKGRGEEGGTQREPLTCPVCDTARSVSSRPGDIPAHLAVPLAGEEWRADRSGVQRLPRAAEEAEHAPGAPAPLQRLPAAVSAPRVSAWSGRPERRREMG